MSTERRKFWVTCPSCKHKFGVNATTVFKYVDRVVAELANDLQKAAKKQTNRGRSATSKRKG